MMNSFLIIGAIAVVASLGLTVLHNNGVFAGGPSATANFAGQVTAGAAQEDNAAGTNFGAHASDPEGNGPSLNGAGEHGRNGLANALTEPGDPQHPSDVIATICGIVANAPGCP